MKNDVVYIVGSSKILNIKLFCNAMILYYCNRIHDIVNCEIVSAYISFIY